MLLQAPAVFTQPGSGRPTRTAIERVVWCSAARDGRYWLGLEQLSESERARADA